MEVSAPKDVKRMKEPTSSGTRAPRATEIDGLRGWASFAVLLFHLLCVVFGEQRTPQSPAIPHPSSTVDPDLPYEVARRQAIDAFEREYVTALLAKAGDNVARAARDAGVNRAYLHRLLRRHGLR